MDEVITLDLGYFLRYITAYLGDGAAAHLETEHGEWYIPVILGGKYRIFLADDLTWILKTVDNTFFKSYGGWMLGLHFTPFGIFTGEMSFTPTDIHRQLPTPGDVL